MSDQALAMIANSSVIDFPDALEWGQWCRRVARAASNGDDELIDRLYQEWESGRKAVD